MGEKTAARARMRAAGVPVVPGSEGSVADAAAAGAAARAIGYPVLLKAAHGGGGRGMRVVRSDADLAGAFRQTTGEAASAFGRGEVFVEKWIERPRHVEVQVLADAHGSVIHLGERECSIQRRHQKLVEESPSVAVTPALREEMGGAAVRAAAAVGYRSAGTVEFLLDASGRFYFLEMNTRLQVEHPVTEMVTGLDLVREQVRIAEGAPLGLRQQEIAARGWAIECRVTAEDPERAFAPSAGRIRTLRLPEGPGVRNDAGFAEGSEVPVYYDSLLAKLIVWGATRDEAIARLRRALGEYVIVGVPTSLPFHRFVVEDEAFRAGDLSTAFVEERYGGVARREPAVERATAEAAERTAALAAAGAAFYLRARRNGANGGAGSAGGRGLGLGPPSEAGATRDVPSAWRAAARADAMRRPGAS
jgi:acetyl-CoA carboxylase biotin carboxylase subunit